MTDTSPFSDVQTPVFILDIGRLQKNLAVAARIRRESGARILLATKAFAMPAAFPYMRPHLDGTTASGVHEARLGATEFGRDVHVYSPAYTDEGLQELAGIASDIYFNSAEQLARFGPAARGMGAWIGLRINPGYSNATLGGALYDPCAPYSRFGEVAGRLGEIDWTAVDTLHVHALCESLHDGSVGLIEHMAEHFADQIEQVSAVNFGGGHFINKAGYDVDALIAGIQAFRDRFGVEVILEPGAGLVVGAGELHASVIGLHENDKSIAILDVSASTHMPDVLEAPYRPEIEGAGDADAQAHSYILAGNTCMTGDVIGEYSFAEPLTPGDELIFSDQMHYSFVKANTFNGTPLANLAIRHEDGTVETVSDFGYDAFRERLGR
ncbi:MAG: carboxynorspermidine decarboxylase [Pseudomonadota bacterium]